MLDYKVTVKVDMKKGASVYDEAKKFRKIFTDNNLSVIEEKHSENSISFAITDAKNVL